VSSGGGNAIEYAAQSRPHAIGLRNIGFDGRRHDGSGGEQLNGNVVQVPANFSPSRRGHVLTGNFHGDSGVRHLMEPGVHTAHQTYLVKPGLQAFRGSEVSQGTSPY
jgi:hypothetical protein